MIIFYYKTAFDGLLTLWLSPASAFHLSPVHIDPPTHREQNDFHIMFPSSPYMCIK